MKQFTLRYTADCYCCDFRYVVIAESLDKAKQLWNQYVNMHSHVQYSWHKAEKAVQNSHGGYIVWTEEGGTDRTEGCYELPKDYYYEGSDHLRD